MTLLKHLIAPLEPASEQGDPCSNVPDQHDADVADVPAVDEVTTPPSLAGFDTLIAKLRSINDADELSSFLHAPAFGYRPAWTPEERRLIYSRRRYLSRRKSGALPCNQNASSDKRQQNNGSANPHEGGESTDVPLITGWEDQDAGINRISSARSVSESSAGGGGPKQSHMRHHDRRGRDYPSGVRA